MTWMTRLWFFVIRGFGSTDDRKSQRPKKANDRVKLYLDSLRISLFLVFFFT